MVHLSSSTGYGDRGRYYPRLGREIVMAMVRMTMGMTGKEEEESTRQ